MSGRIKGKFYIIILVKRGITMAEIFILNTKGCEELILSLIDRVSDKRKGAVLKLKRDEAKIRSIASELLLAYSLKMPLPLSYKTDKNGKPFIPSAPFFNISHSGSFVVCAVSDSEVGVDIEETRKMKPTLIKSILSEKELLSSQKFSGAALQKLLCEKWVRKEAYLKMLGVGLRKSMTSVTFEDDTLLENEVFSRVYDLGTFLLSFCSSDETPVSMNTVSKEEVMRYYEI